MIEEWDAEGCAAEGLENGEGGLRLNWSANASKSCICRLTFSTLPLTPTRVPRLVNNFCDAANETESMEYGAPITSKRASNKRLASLSGFRVTIAHT